MKKILHLSIVALTTFIGLKSSAQGVYWREGFPRTNNYNMPTSSGSAPTVGTHYLSGTDLTWYMYGGYSANASQNCTSDGGTADHIRFATGAVDSPYLVTPVVSNGIRDFYFQRTRASRGYTIQITNDTLASTTNWTTVAYVPVNGTACTYDIVSINSTTARRAKIISKQGTDADIDTIWMTSMTPLPVKWAGISASEQRGQVKVSWNVATEENVGKYVIERSKNGHNFEQVGEVSAIKANSYQWNDLSPVAGVNYYRVVAVDLDGKTMYSSIVKVSLGKTAEMDIAPNPVKGGMINLHVGQLEKGSYSIRVFNNMGQQVYAQTVQHNGEVANYKLQLPVTVKMGIYNLQMTGGSNVINKKIVVE